MAIKLITLKFPENVESRQDLAQKFIKECEPGYLGEYQGWYYACFDDEFNYQGIVRAKRASDLNHKIIIPVSDFFEENNDHSPEPDWSIFEVSREMVISYLESEGENFLPNGDWPDWVKDKDVIEFCIENNLFEDEFEEFESECYTRAIDVAIENIVDVEIEIDI